MHILKLPDCIMCNLSTALYGKILETPNLNFIFTYSFRTWLADWYFGAVVRQNLLAVRVWWISAARFSVEGKRVEVRSLQSPHSVQLSSRVYSL